MPFEQVEEISATFVSDGSILGASTWTAATGVAGSLIQQSGAARVAAAANNSTVGNLHKTPSSNAKMYVETLTESGFGNFGNSWGIFAGAISNATMLGGGNNGYLIRYQYNNFSPTIFRVDNTQSSEYLQVATADPIALVRGDRLGIRVIPNGNGTTTVQATWNGAVVNEWIDTNPLPVGLYGGLRMSRSATSGSSMTGTARYSSGSLVQSQKLAGSIGPTGSLLKGATKLRRATVALYSTTMNRARKPRAALLALAGALKVRKLSAVRRKVRTVELIPPKWSAFAFRTGWNSELDPSSAWRLMIEGSPVIAGSVEELRIGVSYAFGDTADLPDAVQVQIGNSPWEDATVTPISATRCIASTVVGPLVKGSYPIHVKFSAGVETPLLYAGTLAVL